MEGFSNISIIIGIFSTALGVILSILSWRRGSKSDDASSGQQLGVILTTLGGIQSKVDDIRKEQKELRDAHTATLLALEGMKHDLDHCRERAECAHERIDTLKEKLNI